MTDRLQLRSHPVEHCGVINNLRIKSALSDAEPPVFKSARWTKKQETRLYIGEVAASQLPVVMHTLLGSCVAVCLRDPVLGAGGMNHILLPKCRAGDNSPRCGIHAMELLINELMKLGGDRRRFIAKAFGGANVLQGVNLPNIGDRNAKFVREFLAAEKIPLVAERLGGNHAVHVYFRTDTGKATVHTVDGSVLPKIFAAENSYCQVRPGNTFLGGEITLF